MNPFSQFGKPFSNQRISSGFQPTHSPLHPIPRTDTPNTPPSFSSLGFQPTRILDPGISQRVSSPNEAYSVPNKRVRHSQEAYTEVFPEGTNVNNQAQNAAKTEEQGQQAGGRKGSDEGFIPMNTGFRKVQGNYGYNMQENAGLNSNQALANTAQLMALRQYLTRYRKEGQLRDNAQGQVPLSFQNDPLYSILANNMGLTNLLSNSAVNSLNSPTTFDFLRQLEAQQAMQQLSQQLQMNQQLLLNLQDPNKGAPNTRNNSNDPVNPSTMRIPPLNMQSLMDYLSTSSLPANSIGAFLRSEIRDKLQLKNNISEDEFQKPVSNQTAETTTKSGKPAGTSPKEDQKENKPPGQHYESGDIKTKQDNMVNNIVIQSLQEKKIPLQPEAPNNEVRPQRKKSNSLLQKEAILSMDQKKDRGGGERRKNKWQMMIDNNEGSISNDSPSEASTKKMTRSMEQSGRASLRVSSAFRKLKGKEDNIYEDEFSDVKDRKKHRIESSSHRKKKNTKQTQNKDLPSFESVAGIQPSFEFPVEDSNRMSIASSFGRSADEYVLDENDQKIVETRVGNEYQVRILDLDLNLINLAAPKRTVNLAWEPEMFDRETLEAYFAKLQSVLSCNEVNEEKAIKMLIKKNMVPEEVIVTVKKNEKFYSSFLGSSHALRHVKNKKTPEDRK